MTNHDTGKADAKKARIIVGDCLEVLKGFESDSIDSLVTDPPAGIGFMGQEWDHHKGGRAEWVAWMTGVMRECHRVMKPGAHGLVWAIPRTSHWTATALEDAGFEVRDICTHLFGQGFPKSLDISKAIDKAAGAERDRYNRAAFGGNFSDDNGSTYGTAISNTPATDAAKKWQGFGTALKPAVEVWILVRKRPEELTCEDLALSAVPSTRLTMHGLREAEDLLARTVADLNAPQGQKERLLLVGRAVNGLEATDMSRLAQSVDSIDLSTDGYGNRPTDQFLMGTISITEMETHSIMSFPILSACNGTFIGTITIESGKTIEPSTAQNIVGVSVVSATEALMHFQSGQLEPITGIVSLASESTSLAGVIETVSTGTRTIGHIAPNRFFYCAKISPGERDAGLSDSPDKVLARSGVAQRDAAEGNVVDKGSGFNVAKVVKNNHPTVKPQKLMRYLCKLVTPPGGTVLDPFMGSGSTGIAALSEGFRFIGIEREPEYFEIAEKRIFNHFPEAKKEVQT